MAGNVIDSLVVTLGLDSKGFSEGIKGSSEQLAGLTRRLAGMFLAVRGIEDMVGYFKDLHAQLAEIGFTSKNLGVAGTELKKLGEVSELFGGQMQDAADSVQGLQSAVFNLRFKGQVNESLQMLQRFGVAYLDAAGHARKFRDIALDASKAIDKQAKVAGLNQGERYQLALSFGFTGGVASAVAQGGKGLEDALGKAQVDQKALAEKTIDGQVKLERQLIRTHESLAAVNSNLLAKVTPAIEKLNQWMQQLVSKAIPLLIRAIDGLIAFFKNPPPWLKSITEALGPIGTLAAGLAALTLAISAGGALVSAITSLGAFLLSLPVLIATSLGLLLAHFLDKIPGVKSFGENIGSFIYDALHPQEASAASFTPNNPARRGVIARPGAPPPTPTAPRQPSAAAQSAAAGTPTAGAPGAHAGTTVSIDTINVNTRATDADGIAGSIDGAMRRKMLVSTADPGQG